MGSLLSYWAKRLVENAWLPDTARALLLGNTQPNEMEKQINEEAAKKNCIPIGKTAAQKTGSF
jgi:hypothetical protein